MHPAASAGKGGETFTKNVRFVAAWQPRALRRHCYPVASQ
jgi:hypothetical protein